MPKIKVEMYNEVFFIDKETGEGFGYILKKIDPLLTKYSNSVYLNGYTKDDVKQEVSVIAIEGIRAYDPSKLTKLSTFLHTHIQNKISSKIKSHNKKSNNATLLKSKDDQVSYEIPFGDIIIDNDFQNNFEYYIEDGDSFLSGLVFDIEDVEFNIAMKNLKTTLDRKSWELINCISNKNMTLKEASEYLNINIWNASSILKKLKKNRHFKKYFEKK